MENCYSKRVLKIPMGRLQNDATIKQLQSVQPHALSSKPRPQKPCQKTSSQQTWMRKMIDRQWLGKKGRPAVTVTQVCTAVYKVYDCQRNRDVYYYSNICQITETIYPILYCLFNTNRLRNSSGTVLMFNLNNRDYLRRENLISSPVRVRIQSNVFMSVTVFCYT